MKHFILMLGCVLFSSIGYTSTATAGGYGCNRYINNYRHTPRHSVGLRFQAHAGISIGLGSRGYGYNNRGYGYRSPVGYGGYGGYGYNRGYGYGYQPQVVIPTTLRQVAVPIPAPLVNLWPTASGGRTGTAVQTTSALAAPERSTTRTVQFESTTPADLWSNDQVEW